MTYSPPLTEIAFALDVQAGFGAVREVAPEAGEAVQEAVLAAAGALAADVLAPLNHSGDREGARLIDGAVVSPAGFPAAWRAFSKGGWSGLSGDAAHGGQGLPKALEAAVYEILHAAKAALDRRDAAGVDAPFQTETLSLALFYGERVLAMTPGRAAGVMQGAQTLGAP